MLHLFTKLLRDFLARQGIVPADRIFVDPPDRDFIRKLSALPPGRAVNVYLADLRENRKLRTAERRRESTPDGIRETLYPAWVDAHYLISAWDSSTNPSDREKPIREQELLNRISAVLLVDDPLIPRDVYPDPTNAELMAVEEPARAAAVAAALVAGQTAAAAAAAGEQAATVAGAALLAARRGPLDAWPEEFRLPPGLPFQVLPPDGFPKLSEFWTTMGQGTAWRPVVYLVASVPVAIAPSFEYPLVTTLTTVSGQTADAPRRRLIPGTERPWHQIGGRVTGPVREWDRATGTWQTVIRPLENARVVLQIPADPTAVPPRPPIPIQEQRTDRQGRYRLLFAGRAPALRASSDGRDEARFDPEMFVTRWPVRDEEPAPGPGAQVPPSRDTAERHETNYQVAVSYPDLIGDPIPVDLNAVTPFPHDVQLRAAVG